MSTGEGIFSGPDQAALGCLTEKILNVFMATVDLMSHQVAGDETVSDEILSTAVANAHLIGFASAIVETHTDAAQDETLIAGAAEFLRAAISEIRRTQ